MRTLIIIPARLAASRLPGKPLADLGGIPLVVRVAQQAALCPGVDLVSIATDAPEVFAAARLHGVAALMTRSDHASGTDRVAEAAYRLEGDVVLNVQGDEPFVDPTDLHALVSALQAGRADMATLKRPITCWETATDPNVVKVVSRDDGLAMYFSRALVPHLQQKSFGAQSPLVFGHIGVYGYTRQALQTWRRTPVHPLEQAEGLEQLRAMAAGLSIAVLAAHTLGRGIDTPADLAWARQRLATLGQAAFPTFKAGALP